MCRLFAFRANAPTRMECNLVHAQNALLIQSRADRSGLMQILAQSVRELSHWGEQQRAEKPATLNFVLTNGHQLVSSRWNKPLYWVLREGVPRCQVCGQPHVSLDRQQGYRAVELASEPISHEAWQEVPDRHLLGVDRDISVRLEPV